MPIWLIIVLIVLLVLIAGGAIARSAQLARTRPAFENSLERVNRELAAAAAGDRGWDRDTLETAARRVFADEDQAVFRAEHGGSAHRLTLGRSGGDWVHERLEAERGR
jgi:hypothetical protein